MDIGKVFYDCIAVSLNPLLSFHFQDDRRTLRSGAARVYFYTEVDPEDGDGGGRNLEPRPKTD